MRVNKELTGRKYNLLTVICLSGERELPSGKKVIMWHCMCDCGKECDVEQYALVSGKTKSCGCYQNTKRIRTKVALERSGSVADRFPELLEEWNYEKNDMLPSEVPCGSDYYAWWICKKCRNEWQTRVSHRVKEHGCPFCSVPPRRIKEGFNDLKTYCINGKMDYIIKEWDEDNEKGPEKYAPMSNSRVFWKCPFNHTYKMAISGRIGKKSQCPICQRENKTSFAEQAIAYYIQQCFGDVERWNTDLIGEEIDIYVPSLRVAIEYDGHEWHKGKEDKEKCKNELCVQNGIKLIRIREGNLPLFDDCICIVRDNYSSMDTLNTTIHIILQKMGVNEADVDVERDCGVIYEQYVFLRKENSLQNCRPDIANEWHPSKNGQLSPLSVSVSSNKMAWWLCSRGHEYRTSINHRTGRNQMCPICQNRTIIPGENDAMSYCKKHHLQSLIDDWDELKNNKDCIYMDQVAPGSILRVWWKCSKCGYEWRNAINNRVKKKHMCPNCRKNNWPGSKKVQNTDTGDIYDSIIEAAKAVGVQSPSISAVCRGIGKTAGGFHWRYYED